MSQTNKHINKYSLLFLQEISLGSFFVWEIQKIWYRFVKKTSEM